MRTLIILLAATLITGSAVYGAGTWGKTGTNATAPSGGQFGNYSTKVNRRLGIVFAAYSTSLKAKGSW